MKTVKFYINRNQKHFLCTIDTPFSSKSSFVTHIVANVESDDKIDPPIHTENFLSAGELILTLILGLRAINSFSSL